MFSTFEIFSGYMRTVVLPDNMSTFQEGRIRKPGKQKREKSPTLKKFSYLLSDDSYYTSLDANKTAKYNFLFSYFLALDKIRFC